MSTFNIVIHFIIYPIFESIIGILSVIFATITHPSFISIISLYVAWKAYVLQKKSDKDLKRIEDNIDTLENNTQKLSETQDKIAFETEKNRLISATKDVAVPLDNKKEIEDGIIHIFTESRFIISIEDESKREYHCVITFIKEINKLYSFPKMYYLFNKIHNFPFFCVHVDKVYLYKKEIDPSLKKTLLSNFKIKTGYYYLHYHLGLSNNNETGWYIAKRYPITQGLKFIFVYTVYDGEAGISADKFCKNC